MRSDYPELEPIFDILENSKFKGNYVFNMFHGDEKAHGIEFLYMCIETNAQEPKESFEYLLEIFKDEARIVELFEDATGIYTTANRVANKLIVIIFAESDFTCPFGSNYYDKETCKEVCRTRQCGIAFTLTIDGLVKINECTSLRVSLTPTIVATSVFEASKFGNIIKKIVFGDDSFAEAKIKPLGL